MSKRKIVAIVLLTLIALTVTFVVVAFTVNSDLINRFALVCSVIFGFGSLSVSFVALYISYTTYKRSEYEKQIKIKENAKNFIIEHGEDIKYIPLCVIACMYDRHHSYIRKIFNDFNKLDNLTQKEVLIQLNYNIDNLNDNIWIHDSISRLSDFIKAFDIGNDILSNNGELLFKSLSIASKRYSPDLEDQKLFPDFFMWNTSVQFYEGELLENFLTFKEYLDAYIARISIRKDPLYSAMHKKDKPISFLFKTLKINPSDAEQFYQWIIIITDTIICKLLSALTTKNPINNVLRSEINIINFEEKFLTTLLDMYNLSKYPKIEYERFECYRGLKNE